MYIRLRFGVCQWLPSIKQTIVCLPGIMSRKRLPFFSRVDENTIPTGVFSENINTPDTPYHMVPNKFGPTVFPKARLPPLKQIDELLETRRISVLESLVKSRNLEPKVFLPVNFF
jgi:hypothetical protein